LTEFREIGPWYRGEVVVFIMVPNLYRQFYSIHSHTLNMTWTYIVAENIEPSVVRGGLLSQSINAISANGSVHEVVLGDKVCCTRVQATCEKGRHDEVDEWSPAKDVDQEVIECKDRGDIDTVPDGRFLGSDEPWSKGVEKELEGAI
jgi:hypothetical protein